MPEIEIVKSDAFIEWLKKLKDLTAKVRIARAIDRLRFGYLGDFKFVGDNILEIRFHFGSGYRVYITKDGNDIIVLLCGGDKSSQAKDIENAKIIANDYKESKND